MDLGALKEAIQRTSLESIGRRNAFDAVVVGGGAAGGLAAETLTRAGLRILVLDAGSSLSPWRSPLRWSVGGLVSHLANPKALPFMPSWMLYKGRMALRLLGRIRQPVQTACYAWERMPHAFVDDLDSPYEVDEGRPFTWIRARTLGGRVAIPGHGRQYLRFGPADFAPPDGLSPPWPFAASELDPWYAQVERRLGLSGRYDGISWLPDSELKTVREPSESETILADRIRKRWPHARPVLSRYAAPPDTLEGAADTGRLWLRQGAVVRRIEIDQGGHVKGVTWFDEETGGEQTVAAPLVFLCASALESTRILMLSGADGGLGAKSGALGRYLMDHVMVKAEGAGPALTDETILHEDGRCLYLPRFDSRDRCVPGEERGFGVQLYQSSIAGKSLFFTAVAFSEMLPSHSNHVSLDHSRKDRWGIPILRISCSLGPFENRRVHDQRAALRELAEAAGVLLHPIDDALPTPGSAVHECGTARMGTEPGNSVLDPFNQCWDAKGLYVTDSSAFPSQGSQNPTLTVLALTARACGHAVGRGPH